VWPYRDYVINAFNSNKRFDQFTVEQIAGDLIPNPTTEQKVASAYNRLLQTTEEGGAQPKEYEAKYAADRVRNASSVWLAQTMGCCQCHDHKFDPVTTRDFYSFAAFFADVQEASVGKREPGMPVTTPEQESELKRIEGAIAAAKEKLNVATPELVAAQADWEKQVASAEVKWTTLDPESWSVAGESKLRKDEGGVLRSVYKVASRETYTIKAKTELKGVTGFRIEALNDAELPAGGPGTAPNGNFVLTAFKVKTGAPDEKAENLKLQNAGADFSQDGYPVAGAIDGKKDSGWAIFPQVGKAHEAVFETVSPLGSDGASQQLTFILEFQSQFPQHNIGRLRLSATTAPSPSRMSLPQAVKAALAVAPEKRDEAQKKELAAFFRNVAPQLRPVRDEVAGLEKQKKELLAAVPTCLVTTAGPPRVVRVLPRGNWLDETGPVMEPGVPEAIGKLDLPAGKRATRMDLAKWLVSRDNPLTARVFVNRLWMLYFGTGVSKSLEDLGSQGEWPTHPDLLDWLAVEFMDRNWDVKQMVRLIVTSGTYRQSSQPRPDKDSDPFNRLLARQSRFRLDAEAVRDNALAVSGLLTKEIGGKSVFPYQPPGYWFALNFPTREWQNDTGDNLYRRGLYTHWQRSFLHPSLLAFDAPSREECVVERPRSNVPQQALALLNDPTYVEAARSLAERVLRLGGPEARGRIDWAFERVLDRKPTSEEAQVLSALLEKHRTKYSDDVESARKLVGAGAKPVPTDLDLAEFAAWTSVARVILNLHETITRS
jgi:hypothetical protein